MLTIEDIRDPSNYSRFKYVQYTPNRPKPYQAILSRSSRPRSDGSGNVKTIDKVGERRATAEEAAQDYCDHMNGQPPQRRVRTSAGRPDYYMDKDGKLHVDLPPETTRTPARSAQTKKSSERDFMQRMESTVHATIKPHDIAEAKAGMSRQQIVTAVGQLRLKRFEEGRGSMFIVLPFTPKANIAKFLDSENITVIAESKEVK